MCQELRLYRINAQKFYKNSPLYYGIPNRLKSSFFTSFSESYVNKITCVVFLLLKGLISKKHCARINAYIRGYLFLRFHIAYLFCSTNSNTDSNTGELSKFSNPLNIFNAYGPGVYEILCTENNKRYIGEAGNILDRLAKHTRNLEKGEAECSNLQLDWNLFGPSKFEAKVLYIGPEWADREVRLKKELEIISSYSPAEVYNSHPDRIKEKNPNYRVICEIEGKVYQSIAEASRLTGERESKIRAKLLRNFPNYKVVDKVKHGYERIIANGREYESIVDAVAAGEANDRFEALRKLKNGKQKNWNYLSPEKHIPKGK